MAEEAMNMKKSTRIILIVLAVILVIATAFLITAYLTFRSEVETSTDINDYIAYTLNTPSEDEDPVVMPKLETLGNMTDTDFLYCERINPVFAFSFYRLAVSYNEEDYEKEKALLDGRYTFLNSSASDCDFSPDFEYEGYSFRTAWDDATLGLYYPKRMFFVGTNDSERKIIYICYRDSDLDSVYDFTELFRDRGVTVSNKK